MTHSENICAKWRYRVTWILGTAVGLLLCAGMLLHTVGSADASGDPEPMLYFTKLTKGESRTIDGGELGGHLDWGMNYIGFSEVKIYVYGESVPLEEAIRDGKISFEDIVYFARKDAENGICTETFESRLGLTHYTYQYPQCFLRIVDDVFETPAMGQKRIRNLAVYASKADVTGPYTNFLDKETGKRLDQPDYGIECKVNEASPTGAELTLNQSGGQQLGELTVAFAYLTKEDGTPVAENKNLQPDLTIAPDCTTAVTLDWTPIYGAISAGNYQMILVIEDKYDAGSLHPLMPQYFNGNAITVEFTVS